MHPLTIKIGIVCGCLPTQESIGKDDLYHSIIARKVSQTTSRPVAVSSIWYSRICETQDKVLQLINIENPEIILYHVRPDPYLRVSKLFVRFLDSENRFRLAVNLSGTDERVAEKSFSRQLQPLRWKKPWYKKIMRDANYAAGILLSVNSKAIECEKDALREAARICSERNIPLIIIGPASRPRSIVENFLLRRLEKKLAPIFKNKNYNYVSCYGSRSSSKEKLFMEDGVHVSDAGHRRMAELITPVFLNLTSR